MLKQSISQHFSFSIKTHEHFQITAKATCGAFNSSPEVLTLSVLGLIDNISEFLALGIILLHRIGFSHLNIADTHHTFDAVGECLCLLLGNRTFCQVIHICKDTTHDDCHSCEYQYHIRQR